MAKRLVTEISLLAVNDSHSCSALPASEGKFHGICGPPPGVSPYHKPVYNYLNARGHITGYLNLLVEIKNGAINTYPDKSFTAEPGEKTLWLSTIVLLQWGQDENPGTLRKFKNGVHHLLNSHGLDFCTAAKTVRLANPGEENPEVVVDFGDSPYSGARVSTGSFLFNGNSRTQTFD
jgi:hypothetical protein